ncbi:MAG: metallophosphoesterase [Verrucomicrobiae bacterium]|nr:metallophosphoesterase [Verrucomicrobiae bacterium]
MKLMNKNWSFVVLADPELRSLGNGKPPGIGMFRKTLARINVLKPQPEFMILLGDIHVEKLRGLLPEIGLPVHVVHGNHETLSERKKLRNLFAKDFQGRDFYSFKHRKSLFIGLCTAASKDHVGHFESQTITPQVGQCRWIEEQLRAGRRHHHTFVFGHIPPAPKGRSHDMSLGRNDSLFLLDAVRRHKPTALFFGHLHRQTFFKASGAPVYILRSCWDNYDAEPPGFLHVKISPKKASYEFILTETTKS